MDTPSFIKMNGLGNDFVIVDGRAQPVQFGPGQVRAICDRQTGIGCDQLIVMEPTFDPGADLYMRIYNGDGEEVDACGNATRCIAWLMFEEKNITAVNIATNAGVLSCCSAGPDLVSVDMGAPKFDWDEIPLAEEFSDTRTIELQIGPIDDPVLDTPSAVSVGNPHAIFWVDDVEAHDLARFGPLLEHHPMFPSRANISLAQVQDSQNVRVKVWERGAGLTRACGTAACAVAVAAVRLGLTERQVTVHLPGGSLEILWRERDDHIIMTGPVAHEFNGDIAPELLQAGG